MSSFKYALFVFLPAFLLLGWLYFHSRKVLKVFSKIESHSVSSGCQAAKIVLDSFQLFDIRIEKGNAGELSRYLLDRKAVSLSPFDYESHSFAAVGRALYHVGYAVQHMKGNGMLFIKKMFYPLIRLGGAISLLIIPASFIPFLGFLYPYGAFLLTLYILFVFLILPLEWKASREIYMKLSQSHLFPPDELSLIQKVLEVASLRNLIGIFEPVKRLGRSHVPES